MMTKVQEDYLKLMGDYLAEKLNTMALDCKVSLHSDYYYTPSVNCDISCVFITGAIQQKISQHPIQVLVEVEEEFKDDILNVLNDFAYDKNEEKVTLGGSTYRVFFNSPCITQKFVETGVKRRATITMESSIIKFSSVMDCDISISLDNTNIEKIKYTTFALSYVADLSSSGGFDTSKVLQTPQTCMTTYQVSFVPHNDTYLEDKINEMVNTNESVGQLFYLHLKLHTKVERQYTIKCICQSVAYTKDYSGFPTITLSFMRCE